MPGAAGDEAGECLVIVAERATGAGRVDPGPVADAIRAAARKAGASSGDAAKAAGVVYSLAWGDQPALICEHVDWARTCGFKVIAAGKGTGNRLHDIEPGNAAASIFEFRMDSADPAIMMPEVGRSVVRPDLFYEHNVTGLNSVLCAMHERGVGRIVFSSSAAVYGQGGRGPLETITEDAPKAQAAWNLSAYGKAPSADELSDNTKFATVDAAALLRRLDVAALTA